LLGRETDKSGYTYIIDKYVVSARIKRPDLIPAKISPHCFRHSRAMHLLESGVNLIYIRDLLGHISIQTTEIYARADSKAKREAIEAAYQPSIPEMDVTEKIWEKDKKIIEFLKSLA
jgi:integrase/recombinase XerD